MSEYHPDAWVLLKIVHPSETTYKVMGGWYGGYLGCDSWRLCSGIVRIELVGDMYEIHNYSGSIYYCQKDIERFTGLMSSVVMGWEELIKAEPESKIKIEVVDMETYYAKQK